MKIMPTDLPLSHWQRIAEQNGIQRRTFNYRLKKMSPDKAATTPLKRQNNGQSPRINPNSMRQKCLAAGLDQAALCRYRRYHPNTPLSDEQIIERLLAYKAARANPIAPMAKRAGISPDAVRYRLNHNWSLEKALSRPPMTHSEAARIGGKARAKQKRQRRQKRLQQAALNNASTL